MDTQNGVAFAVVAFCLEAFVADHIAHVINRVLAWWATVDVREVRNLRRPVFARVANTDDLPRMEYPLCDGATCSCCAWARGESDAGRWAN